MMKPMIEAVRGDGIRITSQRAPHLASGYSPLPGARVTRRRLRKPESERQARAAIDARFSVVRRQKVKQPRDKSGAIARASTEQILGRPADAAKRDPARTVASKPVAPKWKRHYARLLEIRDGIIDQEKRLQKETAANQPQFITDPGAETANAAFEQDKALGRVSGYQEMLDEVNQALARIEDGTFGKCELTGKPIPQERLRAIPWTRFTVEAERRLEREGKAPVHFEIPPQFTTQEVSRGATEAESELHREQPGSRAGARARKGRFPKKTSREPRQATRNKRKSRTTRATAKRRPRRSSK